MRTNSPLYRFIDDDRKLVSCSTEKIIKIWDMQKGKLVQSLTGQYRELWLVQIEGNTLVSQSRRGMEMWDLEKV